VAVEDQEYPLGEAVKAQLDQSGDVSAFEGILVDADGSEELTFRITGIGGDRLIVDASFADQINYLGETLGYAISPAALLNATLKAQPHFSGIGPTWYSNLRITATAQESDGSTAYSDPWPVIFEVQPVVDQDGIGNTSPGYSVTEEANEGILDVGVYLRDLYSGANATKDSDGSEYVVDYNIDLKEMIDDAQIRQRLKDLEGADDEDINVDLLLKYLDAGTGAYTSNTNGTITVYVDGRSAGFGTMRFRGALFLDSNIDFNLPFRARVRDQANLSSGLMIVETEQSGFYFISINGTADVPNVYANDVGEYATTGVSGTRFIQLNLNGTITDSDTENGGPRLRTNQSEGIYYFMQLLGGTGSFENASLTDVSSSYALVDADGQLVGFDAGGESTNFCSIFKATGIKLICDLLFLQPAHGTSSKMTCCRSFT
jgi:hypothetical protein